jgi:hypothetical protein
MAVKKTKLIPIDTTSEGINVYEIPGINKKIQIVMLVDYQKVIKELNDKYEKLNDEHSELWGKVKSNEMET